VRYRGTWTTPDGPYPSSHLISEPVGDAYEVLGWRLRCGRPYYPEHLAPGVWTPTPEPPATGKTCESCLRLSRRDG
jgi:hypothetical protein